MTSSLAGARVGVTGAGGFIGRALCARLVADGADVAGLEVAGDTRARVEATGAEFRPADITDAATTALALRDRTHVVHTAAIVSDRGPMADFVRVNVEGTRNVLDGARAAGAQRVVHLASVAVWGYAFRHDVGEDDPPRPCGVPYIDTKGASQELALARGATVVRPGDVYGPGSVPWLLRPLEAMRKGRFALPGDGGGLMTPVYIDDLVDCIARVLAHPGAGGVAFTAWDGVAVPAREFFAHHARMLGRDGVRCLPRPLLLAAAWGQEVAARLTGRPADVTRQALVYVSRRATYPNARAREMLGWEPQVALEEGMRRSETWLREEGIL